MSILYGGIIFLREDAGLLFKFTIFLLIAYYMMSFFILWARALAELFTKYRLVQGIVPLLKRLSFYSAESDHIDPAAQEQQASPVSTK